MDLNTQPRKWLGEELYQVTLPYCCAGIIVRANECIAAAPILHWMVGNYLPFIEEWLTKPGRYGSITKVK
jgi:hypothetical protein